MQYEKINGAGPAELKKRINRVLVACLRIGLGVMFVAAAVPKILDPAKFANSLNAYQILPVGTLGIVAFVLPWIELIFGLFLIIGYRIKLSIAVTATMMMVFMGAIISALLRGLDIDCGCFGKKEIIGWQVVIRDSLILLAFFVCSVYYRLFDSLRLLEWVRFPERSKPITTSEDV